MLANVVSQNQSVVYMKQNNYLLILFSSIIIIFSSCSPESQWRRASGATWGTEYHIVYKSKTDLSDSIIAQMRRIDNGVSTFNKESNISKINAGVTDSAGREFTDLFVRSKRICALSNGAFDPTVWPLVDLWGFGADTIPSQAPDSAIVRYILQRVGLDSCSIDASGRLVRKNPRTQFDFGAIAKGYGVDAVAEMFDRNGCTDYMIEIGGEMRLRGLNEHGDKWHVQVDDPSTSGQSHHNKLLVMSISDCSIATSGNYRNLHTLNDGRRVWHTISPVTGYPVESSTLSVTVIAPTCAAADALATACMAMDVSEAAQMIESQPSVSAMFIVDNGHGGTDKFVFGQDLFH